MKLVNLAASGLILLGASLNFGGIFSDSIPSEVTSKKDFCGRFSFEDRLGQEGDELGFYENGKCVGYSNYMGNGHYRALVFGDDWTTPQREWGANYGAQLDIRAFNNFDNKIYDVGVIRGYNVFRGLGYVDILDLYAESTVGVPEIGTLGLIGTGSLFLLDKRREKRKKGQEKK